MHGVILLIETLYNAVSYSVHSFKVDLAVKVLYIRMVQVEQYPQNAMMASYSDMEVTMLVIQLHSSLSDLDSMEAYIPV